MIDFKLEIARAAGLLGTTVECPYCGHDGVLSKSQSGSLVVRHLLRSPGWKPNAAIVHPHEHAADAAAHQANFDSTLALLTLAR